MAVDAWVGSSDSVGSGARGALLVTEAPEEGVETLSETVDREREVPEENVLTTDVLLEEDVMIVTSPSIPIISGTGPSPRLEGRKLLKLCYSRTA